jgi:hypothetical protein
MCARATPIVHITRLTTRAAMNKDRRYHTHQHLIEDVPFNEATAAVRRRTEPLGSVL